MFVNVMGVRSAVTFLVCSILLSVACFASSANFDGVNLSGLDYSKASSHVVTGHILCPPDVLKTCDVTYEDEHTQYLPVHGGGEDDEIALFNVCESLLVRLLILLRAFMQISLT